jgi:hypothetical protein
MSPFGVIRRKATFPVPIGGKADMANGFSEKVKI